MRSAIMMLVVGALLTSLVHGAEDAVFSGPQVGEKLTPFRARGVLDKPAGEEFDLISQADGQPVALIFVNEVTRPSVGLTRLIMNYCGKRSEDGLHSGVVFLTDDPTSTANWMKRASHALPEQVPIGISVDGPEGPGAYGLNRNVTMTVLIGKDNQVTANYALVQPSIQADAPKIAKSIVDVLGGGKAPTLAELGVRSRGQAGSRKMDEKLDSLLRTLLQKTASEEEVDQAAKSIDAYLADNQAAQRLLITKIQRVMKSGKFETYGTPAAREHLEQWRKKFSPADRRKKTGD